MNVRFVTARIAKRNALERCWAGCPGWRILDKANGRSARIVACVECNERSPARLRVTDVDVRRIPAACDAMIARTKAIETERSRRNTTVHYYRAPGTGVMCRHVLGRTPKGKRYHTSTYTRSSVTCDECIRLLSLTPEQRRAEEQARVERLKVVFGAQGAAAVIEKEKRRSELSAQIDAARPEAMVALDIWEQAGNAMPTDGAQFDLVDAALRKAVEAHRFANPKSRGERLWVMRDVRENEGRGNKQCRFCELVLEERARLGEDRTLSGSGDARLHTVPCALRYLAGDLAPRETP